jgi:hypothetical protein
LFFYKLHFLFVQIYVIVFFNVHESSFLGMIYFRYGFSCFSVCVLIVDIWYLTDHKEYLRFLYIERWRQSKLLKYILFFWTMSKNIHYDETEFISCRENIKQFLFFEVSFRVLFSTLQIPGWPGPSWYPSIWCFTNYMPSGKKGS